MKLTNTFSDQKIITKPVAAIIKIYFTESVGRGIKLFSNINDFISHTKTDHNLPNTGINKFITSDTDKLILCTKDWNKFQIFKPTIESYCQQIFHNLYLHPFNGKI